MADNKKSFILYADLIHTVNLATDKQAGVLFKHILSYVNDEQPIAKCITTKILFEPVKQQLKRDLQKYEKKKIQWSEAGKRSAESKKVKKIQRALTSVDKRSTESTVNDNVNDNVSVNDKKNKQYVPLKLFRDDINSVYDSVVDLFPVSTQPKTPKQEENWKEEIRKLIDIDKIDASSIEHIIKVVRRDSFWSNNFLTIMKLRQTDKSGIKYIVKFIEQFKQKENGGITEKEYREFFG